MKNIFLVKKLFLSGALKGLTVSEKTSINFEVGETIKSCAGGSSYKVIEVTSK